MRFWRDSERKFAVAISDFAFANPFDEQALKQHVQRAAEAAEHVSSGRKRDENLSVRGRPEIDRSIAAAAALLDGVARRLESGGQLSPEDFRLYQDLVLVVLYFRFRDRFQETIEQAMRTEAPEGAASLSNNSTRPRATDGPCSVDYYQEFERAWRGFWERFSSAQQPQYACAHTFACLFLIRRAYHHVRDYLWGDSPVMQALRSEVWRSIFSHDFRRFGLLLFNRMEDVTTLISGPSGTGKELVARAIGLSRYIPFDPKAKQFKEDFFDAFHPVNISAFASSVVESELFGHAKGAFTDAVRPRAGVFEQCEQGHAVFLDEIGELSAGLQVKLLRVLQNREFRRVGETRLRSFAGKLIVATNRDFEKELAHGRFREDLYYRLCSDVITTPRLSDQLQGDAGQIRSLAERIAFRQLGDSEAASTIATDTVTWIERELGLSYEWPGNFRELEQCVRNVMIRKSYKPIRHLSRLEEDPTIAAMRAGTCTAEELVSCYCKSVYQRLGSYAATARVVGLDQRTVKRHVLGE